jgi:RNA polymerase sigma-70 factor (ECF subfamily)
MAKGNLQAEARLLQKARKGDKKAFSQLVERLEDTVYRYAYKLCRDQQKAEETLQDTFVNMYRKLHQFDGRSRLSTWLYTIASNSCLMKHRQARSRGIVISLDDLPVAGRKLLRATGQSHSPQESLENRELRSALDRAIQGLPPSYRLVFVMRDLEGLSARETAEVLRISVEATKSRLRRARAALRESLRPFVMA